MKYLLTGLAILLHTIVQAQLNHDQIFTQQSFPVAPGKTAELDGLKAWYEITDSTTKEVGSKGDFNRFRLKFYVTNTSSQAKILYQKPGFMGHAGPISASLVLFKCNNATGARFTNKQRSLDLQPCRLLADVEDYDSASHKTVVNRRMVTIGYFIKPGETVSTGTIMIVPPNQLPDMTATFYPEVHQQIGELIDAGPASGNNQAPAFVRIKNFATGKYLNNQNSPLACTPIERDWWSAQWQIIPVNGSNNFQVINRWKSTFLSSENNTLSSMNGQSARAMWVLEETSVSNVYFIRNLADNAKLAFRNGALTVSNDYNNDTSAQWIIEP